jgi:hypothetical protein
MSGFVSHSVFIGATWVAAIFGGIGIGAAFISAIVGYQLSEESLAEANKRIAEANAQAERARADAAGSMAIAADAQNRASGARREAAQANERAAQLERDAAVARKETAEAQLKLEQLRKLAEPRNINFDVFRKELEGKPKARVQIWYLPDSSDGYWYAFRLAAALSDSGWEIEGPAPIPEPDPHNALLKDMPRAMVAGGQPSGVTVVGSAPVGGDMPPEGTPFRVLEEAILKSAAGGLAQIYGASGSQFMPVAAGTLRVIVAAKPDPIFAPNPNHSQTK